MRLVLKYTIGNEYIEVLLGWRNTSLRIYLYSCKNITGDLKKEIEYRGIKPEDPVSIIPENIIETPLQLIQAALAYKIYSSELERIRNKGLLLAMLATGTSQISEVVKILGDEVEKRKQYYILGVDCIPQNTSECTPLDYRSVGTGFVKPLVKNIRFLLTLL